MHNNQSYSNLKMLEGRDKILKFTQNHKPMKRSFATYTGVESLLQKMQVCNNGSTKFFTSKMNKQTNSVWLFIIQTLPI